VLDGLMISKEAGKDVLDMLVKPDDIDRIDVIKGPSAIEKYGEKGKNGVVSITTKTGPKHDFSGANVELTSISVDDNSPVFNEVEIAPKFPGGEAAMNDYVKKQVKANEQFAGNKKDFSGSCAIRFIVDKYGKLSNYAVVNSTATTNSKLASLVIEILQKGPSWNPALQNGNKVRAFHEIVFKN
jgi:outer membrane receptor for Fe3+-dicitrate